jgi:AraC-like DNA-binding protein
MEYTEYRPDPTLASFVECYWYAFSERPPFREKERLIPDGTIELIFNFGDDYSHVRDDGIQPVRGSHVIGIRRHALIISQTARQHLFCIRFKPGGLYPFFRVPVHRFANGFYGVEELFGSAFRELEERLYDAENNAERVRLADGFLRGRLGRVPEDHAFVGEFARQLLRGDARIGELADRFGTSYKTLERRFSAVIGLTPSELHKIERFNRAVLSMYSSTHGSLTRTAYDCGYYDQSHFIREFKRLTGSTPRAFLREQYTIVAVIQPALAERLSNSYNF